MADELNLDFDKILAHQSGSWTGGTGDWITAFGKSALESIPELVGIQPSEDTLKFRADNTIAGYASQLAGMAVPYGGWLRGARLAAGAARATGVVGGAFDLAATPFSLLPGVGRVEKAAQAIEAAGASTPFMTAAKAEAVRLAPFEIGRTLVSQAVGDKSLVEMTFDAGMNLALGAGVAGGLARVGGLAKVAPGLKDLGPGIDETLPPQLLMRKIDEIAPGLAPEQAAELLGRRPDIEARARTELPPKGHRYVDPEIGGGTDYLERIFNPDPKKLVAKGYVETKLPASGQAPETFATPDDWQRVFRAGGIDPETATKDMQFPRIVRVTGEKDLNFAATSGLDVDFSNTLKAAKGLEENIAKGLTPVGDGWFLKREPNDGMFVMAKKVVGEESGLQPTRKFWTGQVEGEWQTWHDPALIPPEAKRVRARETVQKGVAKPGVNDTWLVFKTDRPGQFSKQSQEFMNASVAKERWLTGAPEIEALAKDQEGVAGAIVRLADATPLHLYADLAAASPGGPKGLGRVFDKLVPKAIKGNGLTQAGAQLLRTYLTPFDKQFAGSVRGTWASGVGRLIQEAADTHYQKLFQGPLKFDSNRGMLGKIMQVPGGPATVSDLWTAMDKDGVLADLMRLRQRGIGADGVDDAVRLGIVSPKVGPYAKELEGILQGEHAEFNKAQRAAGKKETPWEAGSYGLPRSWDGDYMHLVRDESGAIVGVAAGGSAKEAAKKAGAIVEDLRKTTGGNFRPAEAFWRNASPKDLPQDALKVLKDLSGSQARGFKWDTEIPSLAEVLDESNKFLQKRARALGTNMRSALLDKHIAALTVEAPDKAKILAGRFDQMAGKEGEFSQAVNRATDKILAPLGFGSNTASKIAAYTNTGMTHLQLGAFKLSFPLQNLVGTVQVIAPELAFVMNAPREALHVRGYMHTAPAVGQGGVRGSVSTLAPVKILGQAVRMLFKPTGEERAAIELALNHRVVDARVAEDFIGQNRRTLSNWKGALTSPKAFGEFTLALSEWLPMQSERFARTVSFAAGYRVARDVLRLEQDEAYLFARRFTERTNYLYSSADRPLVFTGPIGSSLGLFKNWQLNFMHTMAEYANHGVSRNIWSPLLWQTMSTAAIGGVAATPLYWVANGASNLFAQKKLVQLAYDEYGDRADGVMFGLPAALTGVSLSSLMTEPGANPVKDATQLFGFAAWSRMREAGAVVHAAMDNWQATGQHPASDPDVRNGLIKAFAPVLLQRAMAIDDGTVRNISTGMVQSKGLSTYDRVMYQMGLQPVTIERQMAASEILYQDREKMKSATKAFGDALQEALKSGSGRAVDLVMERAIAQGVDIGNVFKSAFSREKLSEKTSAERLAKPQVLEGVRSLIGGP